jgi:hypothetical protein
MSAVMRLFVGLWWKTSSLLRCEWTYSQSNSASNSGEIEDMGFEAEKRNAKGTFSLPCLSRFSGRESGPRTEALG